MCVKNNKILQNGFTLIEMLVVFAIIFIIASISFAGYNRFNKQQQINIEYENLKNTLAEAKSNSISQVITLNCTGVGKAFLGYRVSFTSTTYQIYEVCNTLAGEKTFAKRDAVNLSSKGLSLNYSAGYIQFKPLLGGASQAGNVTISNGTPSQNKTISVTTEGNIQ
jgi:prepilin-type N-terminal cleavage/methylation domain-containing protein